MKDELNEDLQNNETQVMNEQQYNNKFNPIINLCIGFFNLILYQASWLDFVRMEDLEVQFGSRNNARSYDSGRAYERSYDGYVAADVRSGYDNRSYDGSCRSSGQSYDRGSYYSDHSSGLLPHPSRNEPSPSSSGHPSSFLPRPPNTTPSSSSYQQSSSSGYETSSPSASNQQFVPSNQSQTSSTISQSLTSNSELKDSNSTNGHEYQSYYSDSVVSNPSSDVSALHLSSQNSSTSQTFPSSHGSSSNYLLAPPGMTQTLPSQASVPYSYEMQSQYFTPPQAGYQQYGYASYPPTGNGHYNPYLTAPRTPPRTQRKRSRSPSPVRDRKR